MNFGAPLWLWGLLMIPVLVALFLHAEHRSAIELREFVAPRLLAQLGATISPFRRRLRFALIMIGVALAIVSLAKPRWGYTYEDVKRKGLDLIIAIDTSRSMLANDVPPNRLERVKLAAQDLINELRGDRIGLIAFAGRAFLQAPLTIDYDAAVESLTEFDTNIIPEGGTNISEAINLAVKTYGKSAVGNRALIIFTDGEELAGDAVKVAKEAADAGVRIFTIGVGTPEGSLIPLTQAGGGTSFVKDGSGQVVKSKLDEKRLREIAEVTGGMFLLLENGPKTMQELYREGIAKMQAGQIDARTARRPIERYQWPLAAALLALAASLLINERRTVRRRSLVRPTSQTETAVAALALIFLGAHFGFAAAPGLDEYNDGHFNEAYGRFQQTLKEHPETEAADKIQFDSGAAAYRMKDYGKALQSFSQALLSPDLQMQSRSHYNLGNTLYQRGEAQKTPNEKLKDWMNALQHYEQTLKIEPDNKEAKENYEYVKNKIEDLKKQQPTPTPTPTPTPSPSPKPPDKKDQKKNDQQQDKDKDKNQNKDQDKNQDQNKDKDQQQQNQSGQGDQKDQQKDQQKSGQSPTPTPTPSPSQGKQDQQQGSSPSPTPSPNESSGGASPSPSPGQQQSPSPTPGENGASPSPSPGENEASPTPSPGEGENEGEGNESPTPGPSASASPSKKPTGDVKGASEDRSEQKAEDLAEEEVGDENQMTPQQAERLLRSMKDEEKRVQLDERKAVRRVYKDW